PQPVLLYHYWYRRPAGTMFTMPLPTLPPLLPPGTSAAARSWVPDPAPLSSRAVWKTGESASHWAIRFDNAYPGSNVVLRPSTVPGTENLRAWMLTAPITDTSVPRTLAADAGCGGGATAPPAAPRLFCYKVPVPLPPPPAPGTFVGPYPPAWQPVNGSSPMVPLECAIPAGGPAYRLLVGMEVEGFTGDPAYPPALWGVRVVP